MSRILHSHKYVAYLINQKNKINYLKNGGAQMRVTKIFREEKENFFDEMKKFLEDEEKKAAEIRNEEILKKQEVSFDFEKQFLKNELDEALNSFNLSRAGKIKQKLDELQKMGETVEES